MSDLFILASGSPRRRQLLEALGIRFIVIKPEIDETQRHGEAPLDYVRRLSVEKCAGASDRAAAEHPQIAGSGTNVITLAADTIVIHKGEVLGKPANAAEARAMLRRLRGEAHTVCTALTLRCTRGSDQPVQLTDHACTTVIMRSYSDDEIEAYIATGDPFDKAGSYAIQHEGFQPVAAVEGSRSNVVGLPVELLSKLLAQIGQPLPTSLSLENK
ncbi:MAG: Maf family protein [Aggregatilineales bacterium]